ncbi:hypothetical protein WM08_06890 [Burkholderia ubonensis]|nr:hypothetical protein WL78_23325 [Burkholderia ubonensis]KWI73680.1 hypothetical protein WM07_09245 [Burkholderia ubonensis]KWI93393.1 hypothetical protein WM08_06890 [Burkholderia ubonensis]
MTDEADESLEPVTFDQFVDQLLAEAIQSRKKVPMSDEEIDSTVQRMLEHAVQIDSVGATFKTNELYFAATGNPWTKLEPSVRKSIGKRFRAAIGVHADAAKEGERIVEFSERNINNAAVYRVDIKTEWELL